MLNDEINSGDDSNQEEDMKCDAEEIPSVQLPIFRDKKIVAYTIVDQEDEYKLKGLGLTQCVNPNGYTTVRVTPYQQQSLPLSHFLHGVPPQGFIKDHINRNSFDNRKRNLRNATLSQQAQNIDKKENCSSIYKGVSWSKQSKKWCGYASFNKQYHFGFSENELETAKAYDKFILYHYGEHAKTNDVLSQEEKLEALKTPPKIVKRKEPKYGTRITKPFTKYIAQWVDINGKQKTLSFDKLEDAIATREAKVQEIIDEKLHLLTQEVINRDENGIPIIKTNKKQGISFDIKVDEKFYYYINQYNWSYKPGGNPTSTINGKYWRLPNFVLSLAGKQKTPGETVDHIYQDYTYCRSTSLRYASKSQQSQNRRKRKNTKRKYIGVQQSSPICFTANIKLNNDKKVLGSFKTELEAAQAYDKGVDFYYPGGMKNFPTQ
jgi:hypothetical protein